MANYGPVQRLTSTSAFMVTHYSVGKDTAAVAAALKVAAQHPSHTPSDAVRLRAGSKMKAPLLKVHRNSDPATCKLLPGDNYTSVFSIVEVVRPPSEQGVPPAFDACLERVGNAVELATGEVVSKLDAAEEEEEEAENAPSPPAKDDGAAVEAPNGKQKQKKKKKKKKASHAPSTPLILWGWSPRANDWSAGDNEESVICRAQHKLAEAFATSKILANFAGSAAASAAHALDVGASPGGWTACLAENCGHVVAVDTGALHEDVLKLPNVTHIPVLLPVPADADPNSAFHTDTDSAESKDALSKIIALAPPGGFGIVTCDINAGPADACDIVMRAKQFLAPKALLVITMKLVWRGRNSYAKAEKAEKAVRAGLAEHCSEDMEMLWLFSNTQHERTLIAQLK